uniref:Uncharacterized protein LOC104221569 isoform X3 n=1 Tax=Nicotiana sylvestris TaxID=4096 RepID=A0A1U7VSS4_NICSY|nr:PREDICTED: uncharacterized protein LOC104221569 isoform X3 [Nicotiana sylvestris]
MLYDKYHTINSTIQCCMTNIRPSTRRSNVVQSIKWINRLGKNCEVGKWTMEITDVVAVEVTVVEAVAVVTPNRSKAVEAEEVGPRWVHTISSHHFSLHSYGATSQGHLVRVNIRVVGLLIISRVRVSTIQLVRIRVVVVLLGSAVVAVVLLGRDHHRSSDNKMLLAAEPAVVLLGSGHRHNSLSLSNVVVAAALETSCNGMWNPVDQEHQMFVLGVHLQALVVLSLLAVEVQNQDYSHFVSLPLAIYPELVNKLINFQNSVLGITEVSKSPTSESKASELLELGIEKSIFINPKTFHLTVLMLKLWNKDRFEAAAQVLRSVSPKVLDALESRPVSIRLKGLECMRGSPAKAYVVYAPVEVIGGEARLLRACQVIIDAFTEAGLVLEKDANRKLKLHATIMNVRHSRSKNRSGYADPFDARAIFDQYGSEEWGECLIREAHLSQRFVYGDNGYYHCCESIPFPEGM